MRFGFILLFVLSFYINLNAQIERYRNQEDTATYIAPEDTITKAPVFGNSENDFFSYIEVRFNKSVYGQFLNLPGINVHFSFNVEKNGSVSDLKIISTDDNLVASEIERIVAGMPKWSAGKLDGKRKKTLMVYDIIVKNDVDLNQIVISKNGLNLEYTNQTKPIKLFLVAGALLIMTMVWITR